MLAGKTGVGRGRGWGGLSGRQEPGSRSLPAPGRGCGSGSRWPQIHRSALGEAQGQQQQGSPGSPPHWAAPEELPTEYPPSTQAQKYPNRRPPRSTLPQGQALHPLLCANQFYMATVKSRNQPEPARCQVWGPGQGTDLKVTKLHMLSLVAQGQGWPRQSWAAALLPWAARWLRPRCLLTPHTPVVHGHPHPRDAALLATL